MKYYQIIVDFRKAYRKLNYLKNKFTVDDLFVWVKGWCGEHKIPENMIGCFYILGLAYVDEDIQHSIIYHWEKRQSKQKQFSLKDF